MVIIKFPNGSDWWKANWIYRQIVEDALALFPNDRELEFRLRQGEGFGRLSLATETGKDSAQVETNTRILTALKKVAEETLAGRIKGWAKTHPDDIDGTRMYGEALSELLHLSAAAAADNS